MKVARYFFFSYRYPSGFGNYFCWTEGGHFPGIDFVTKAIAERIGEPQSNIVIAGWNEFKSKEDYEQLNGAAIDSE